MKISSKFCSLLIRLDRRLTYLKENHLTEFYHQLAKFLGGHSPRSKWVAIALGLIVENDSASGEPLRSSLIIRMDTYMPGDGYWWKLEEQGLIKDKNDQSEREAFWQDQMAKLGVTPPAPSAA